MPSTATITESNMVLTPCRVSYGTAGAEADLGATLGNVKVTLKYTKAELKADQMGTSPIDRAVTGFMAQVEFEVAEIQNKTLLATIFPTATMVTSGSNKALDFKTSMGSKDSAKAKSLILHPLDKDDSDLSFDINFDKAVASEESDFGFGNEQGKMKLVFNVYPNSSGVYCRIGDPALT